MATIFSHAVAALGIGACFYSPEVPKRVWVLGALCAAVPDLDVIGFGLGIDYADPFGHRGLTHSLFFAALLAAAVVGFAFPKGVSGFYFSFFALDADSGFAD